ncbi:MAG: hypothetical protein AAB956_04160 [Patescibacteria group bacterium]
MPKMPKFMKVKREKNKKIINNTHTPLTITKLAEFTEAVVLPAVKEIVKEEVSLEIGRHRHEMKMYIDSKLAETKGDIIAFIKGDKERDKNWKIKIIEILKRQKLVKVDELNMLLALAR